MSKDHMTITVERDSVCMGDDVYAPNTMTLEISRDMSLSAFLAQLAEQLPCVADPEPIVWSVHVDQSKGTAIGLIETVYQVGSKVTVFGSDRNIQRCRISRLYCRYFHKNSLMQPDQDSYLRVPMYPECATLLEKVKKHLNAGK